MKLVRITTVPVSLKILLKGQLKYMRDHFDVVGISSKGGELNDVKADEGVRTIELNMSRKIAPLEDLISLSKMISVFIKEKPDIVHTHTPKAGIVGMLAAWICRVPIRLHTVAGLPVIEATGYTKKILLCVEKLTYFCATKIYPNSVGLEDYILANKLTARTKLKVIGNGSSNGIDTEFFAKSEMTNGDIRRECALLGRLIFLYIGRIVADKGVNELVHAFDKISQEHRNVSLLLVGPFEDDLDPISSESLKVIDGNSDILTHGFVEDVRPYLSCCDVLVLPTYREGFPNVLLQACSMGVPCITTNINGCNEIIQDNHNGILIEPKDREGLYEAMERFILVKGLAKRLSEYSRNEIIEKFDRKRFHQYLLKEYSDLLR
jgi:glycosyltransferase involved in cell wall biosynthesis